MKRGAILLGALFVPSVASAATIMVTPQDGYQKIEAAKPGDEVVLAPGKYTFRVYLQQKGTPQQPIVIRAQDPNNKPVVDLGGNVDGAPGSYTAGDKGRGCWQMSGATNIQINGIVFQNCRTSSYNSAGIRYYNGSSISLKDCVFKQNDNGLTGGTQDSSATVEFSEFDSNGNTMASQGSPTHNIYIYGGTFVLRYSYLHDPVQGQNFHIRAHDATIEYNWFARPKSYSGDLMTNDDCQNAPCSASMLLRGNLIHQGNPNNTGQIVAVYNDAGITGATFAIRAIWNTVVVTQQNGHFIHLSNADGTQMTAEVSNNVISGGGVPVLVETANKATVSGTNNWFPMGTQVGQLTASVFGSSPFKNPGAMDYTLAMGSNAIGAASQSVMGAPNQEYYQNETNARMYRLRAMTKDIGAFESTTTGNGVGPYGAPPPNPDGGTNPGPDGGSNPGGDGGVIPGGDGGNPGGYGPGGTSGGCSCDASAASALGSWPAVLVLFALRRRKR